MQNKSMKTLAELIRDLGAVAGELAVGPCAIALGGSHAKGVADAQSDIDIYVFAESWLPDAERTAKLQALMPGVVEARSWSAMPEQGGTDFSINGTEVEIWFRQLGPIAGIIERSVAGEAVRRYVTWTPNGYSEHCALADLTSLKVIADPHALLTPLLDRIAVYPPALRATLIRQGLASAGFWRDNFHLETALARADGYYLQSIAHQIVTDLIQALFAVNRVHFPGDKKMATHIGKLSAVPEDFMVRADGVLGGNGARDKAAWRARFAELYALADEVAALAEA